MFNQLAQRRTRPGQVRLTANLVQVPWPHPDRERRDGLRGLFPGSIEQAGALLAPVASASLA